MKRRAYLAAVGTGAIAGCLGSDEAEREGNENSDDTSTDDDRDLPPVEDTETDETVDDADSESDEANGNDSEDKRQETSDQVELERAIERAENEYKRAMAEYARQADGDEPTFIDVLPSTDLSSNNAREHLRQAREILWSEARQFAHTAAEQQRVREYRTYDDVITTLYRIQRSIHRTYMQIDTPDERTTYSSKPSSLRSGTDDHSALGEKIAGKEMYMDELVEKYEQQRWQLTLLDRAFSALVNVRSSQNISNRSMTNLRFAREEWSTIIAELEDPASASPTDRTDEAFLSVAREWHTLVDETLRKQ